MTRARSGAAITALLLSACGPTVSPDADQATSNTVLDQEGATSDVVTVDLPQGTDPARGATPMNQRVAVLGLLNKRNGASRDLTLRPGMAVRSGNVIVRLRACEQTAPWEQTHYTGAFVQVDAQRPDHHWHRAFSGWLYKERPALNAVEDPIYDVWPKSCAMTFPDGGPDSVALGTPGNVAAANRSSAKKSAPLADEDGGSATPPRPIAPTIAAESNLQ